MPAYNAGLFISEAIASVLSQTFRDFELLIINDGSTDDTAAIIRTYHDDRIVLIEQENRGIAAALNKGLQHAGAPIIARFDADDICFPQRLEKQYGFLMENPHCVVVGSAATYIDADGQYVYTHRPPAITDEALQQLPVTVCPFIHASVMFRKDAVKLVGYNEHAPSFQDHLLWRQLKTKGKMYNMPEPLISVRLNPGSLTIDERKRPKEFRLIKKRALQEGRLSAADGQRLGVLMQQQGDRNTKEGAYYTLLAKKYLWNNHDPVKARQCVKKAISLNSFDIKDYMLWPVSFLPRKMIIGLYETFGKRKR